MFEPDIERSKIILLERLISPKPFVYLRDIISNPAIEYAFKQYFDAEFSWWLYEEQMLRHANPHLDLGDPAIQSILGELDAQFRRTARFNREQITAITDAAVKSILNYRIPPTTTLKWFVFRGEPTKPIHEVLLRMRHFADYAYLHNGIEQWLHERGYHADSMEILPVIEFEKLIKKIDDDTILELSPSQFVSLINPIFLHFADAAKEVQHQVVPIEAIIVFLDDKEIHIIAQKLERMLYQQSIRYINRDMFLNVVDEVLSEVEVQEAQSTSAYSGMPTGTPPFSPSFTEELPTTITIDTEPLVTAGTVPDSVLLDEHTETEIPLLADTLDVNTTIPHDQSSASTESIVSVVDESAEEHFDDNHNDSSDAEEIPSDNANSSEVNVDTIQETHSEVLAESTPNTDTISLEIEDTEPSSMNEHILSEVIVTESLETEDIKEHEDITNNPHLDMLAMYKLPHNTYRVSSASSAAFSEILDIMYGSHPREYSSRITHNGIGHIPDAARSLAEELVAEQEREASELHPTLSEQESDAGFERIIPSEQPSAFTHRENSDDDTDDSDTIVSISTSDTIHSTEEATDTYAESSLDETHHEIAPTQIEDHISDTDILDSEGEGLHKNEQTDNENAADVSIADVDSTPLVDEQQTESSGEILGIISRVLGTTTTELPDTTSSTDDSTIEEDDTTDTKPIFGSGLGRGLSSILTTAAHEVITSPPPTRPSIATFIDAKQRATYIRKLCNKDELRFDGLITKLDRSTKWKEALAHLDQFYAEQNIDPQSATAGEFRMAVYRRFVNPA